MVPLPRTVLANEVGAFPAGRAFHIVHPAWLGFRWWHMSLACGPLVSGRRVAQLTPMRVSESLESKKNAESGVFGADRH